MFITMKLVICNIGYILENKYTKYENTFHKHDDANTKKYFSQLRLL